MEYEHKEIRDDLLRDIAQTDHRKRILRRDDFQDESDIRMMTRHELFGGDPWSSESGWTIGDVKGAIKKLLDREYERSGLISMFQSIEVSSMKRTFHFPVSNFEPATFEDENGEFPKSTQTFEEREATVMFMTSSFDMFVDPVNEFIDDTIYEYTRPAANEMNNLTDPSPADVNISSEKDMYRFIMDQVIEIEKETYGKPDTMVMHTDAKSIFRDAAGRYLDVREDEHWDDYYGMRVFYDPSDHMKNRLIVADSERVGFEVVKQSLDWRDVYPSRIQVANVSSKHTFTVIDHKAHRITPFF